VNISFGEVIKVLLIVETPLEMKIAPSDEQKGQYLLSIKPSHLPEHPSVGIGTFSAFF
jgi:hypothetical protein